MVRCIPEDSQTTSVLKLHHPTDACPWNVITRTMIVPSNPFRQRTASCISRTVALCVIVVLVLPFYFAHRKYQTADPVLGPVKFLSVDDVRRGQGEGSSMS